MKSVLVVTIETKDARALHHQQVVRWVQRELSLVLGCVTWPIANGTFNQIDVEWLITRIPNHTRASYLSQKKTRGQRRAVIDAARAKEGKT